LVEVQGESKAITTPCKGEETVFLDWKGCFYNMGAEM